MYAVYVNVITLLSQPRKAVRHHANLSPKRHGFRPQDEFKFISVAPIIKNLFYFLMQSYYIIANSLFVSMRNLHFY